MSAGPVMRPSTRVMTPGRNVSANATTKKATANTRRAVPSEMPSGSSGTNISKAVELVRGMAKHGPMARYTAATKNSPNLGCTRPASSRAVPASATAIKPITGRPMAAIKKPIMASGVAVPAWSASNGGMMRLPAPKSIENRAMPTVTTWSERRPREADEAMRAPFESKQKRDGQKTRPASIYALAG